MNWLLDEPVIRAHMGHISLVWFNMIKSQGSRERSYGSGEQKSRGVNVTLHELRGAKIQGSKDPGEQKFRGAKNQGSNQAKIM